MARYYVGVSATGDGDGSSPSDRFSQTTWKSVAQPGDLFSFADGAYTVIPEPDNDGESGNWIVCVAENFEEATDEESARGIVFTDSVSAGDVPRDFVYWRGFDLDTNRECFGLVLDADGGSGVRRIFSNCRQIRPWNSPTASITHSNFALRSNNILFYNCWNWHGFDTNAGLRDIRVTGDSAHHIHINGGGSFWSTHDLIGIRGDSTDFDATLANRDVAHDILIKDHRFIGGKHPYSQRDGAYNIWLYGCTFESCSTGDQFATNQDSLDYNDATFGSSGDVDLKSDAIRVWCYSNAGGFMFCQIWESGNVETSSRNSPISITGGDSGGEAPTRRIEAPPRIAHCTVADSYAASIMMNSRAHTEPLGQLIAPKVFNSILLSGNKNGEGGTASEWGDAEIRYFSGATGIESGHGSGIWGSVIGSSGSDDVVVWAGTPLTLAEAKLDANVDKDIFDIDSSNVSVNPQFADLSGRDFAPENPDIADMGVPVAHTTSSGTNVSSIAIDDAALFWDGGEYLDVDESTLDISSGTLPTVTTEAGTPFWIIDSDDDSVHGPFNCTSVSRNSDGSGTIGWSGGTATFGDNSGLSLVDPQTGIYAGAVEPENHSIRGNARTTFTADGLATAMGLLSGNSSLSFDLFGQIFNLPSPGPIVGDSASLQFQVSGALRNRGVSDLAVDVTWRDIARANPIKSGD